MLSGPFFGLAFVFSINSLILSGFPMTSFHLLQASLSAFSLLYTTLVCAVVQKCHEMSFIYNYSHFQYSFWNQSVLFAQLENVNYGTTNASCMNQVTLRSNWPRVTLFDLAQKQCSGITKGCLHYLTLELKGRFLVSNISK